MFAVVVVAGEEIGEMAAADPEIIWGWESDGHVEWCCWKGKIFSDGSIGILVVDIE